MTGPVADQQALRIATEHGIDGGRLLAYDGLARSRGVELTEVLRSFLRGELREVVLLPPRRAAVGN